MKRILLISSAIAALLLTSTSCETLKIYTDKTTSDGVRTVITTGMDLADTKVGKMQLALGVRLVGQDTVMAVAVICDSDTDHGIFNKGNQMKFRLSDKSEFTLENLLDKKFISEEETHVSEHYQTSYGCAYSYRPRGGMVYVHPYEVTEMVPNVYVTKTHFSTAVYLLTREQLIDIIQKGVVKMRIETEDDDIDITKTEKVSSIFKSMINCLAERVLEVRVRSEF